MKSSVCVVQLENYNNNKKIWIILDNVFQEQNVIKLLNIVLCHIYTFQYLFSLSFTVKIIN